ncbi:YggT family protein [Andreprevotia chitinilytica]|uniref:YggT family protein n=1 Tax=Andreprevotia chitinilytica TaxID=396808 RepID=UPI000553A144|nr:YggT family protein [Andreprevotia chitinilytica]
MVANALAFLIQSLAGFFVLALLARFYLISHKVSFKNQLGQFVLALTNWMVLPTRRVLPSLRQYDTSSFVLAWLWACGMHGLLLSISPWPYVLGAPLSLLAIGLAGLLEVIKMSLYLLFGAVIGQALMSWVAPYNPMMPVFNALTNPWLRPLRKIIPPVGSIDITPMFLSLVIIVANIFVTGIQQNILASIRIAA